MNEKFKQSGYAISMIDSYLCEIMLIVKILTSSQ
jgi:hypothetical protein